MCRVEERSHVEGSRAHRDDVGALAWFQRANLVIYSHRARALDCAELQYTSSTQLELVQRPGIFGVTHVAHNTKKACGSDQGGGVDRDAARDADSEEITDGWKAEPNSQVRSGGYADAGARVLDHLEFVGSGPNRVDELDILAKQVLLCVRFDLLGRICSALCMDGEGNAHAASRF